ncbi:BlaI/MecI/CopY family transcriptional regulator [Kangiella taiwanensis]|uniref:BlaI/MecI/CopY family transcriptional regulator n=1 Tax=Kangiella taiwanensis TaxID=1079179 RepID=A0ABP8HR05_9GAMM|nr:BlaI/MecI/CopY family transcriptional regulator [Kangiella taiwanensis]
MTIRVSEAEKSVMDVLWQESPLSSVEVVEKLQSQEWSEKTVKTFLNRLVKKGVVSFEKDGRRYLYSPAIEREEFLADESEGFLDKVFKGNMKELLATFVENKQLSQNELDYLKGLLDDNKSDKESGNVE